MIASDPRAAAKVRGEWRDRLTAVGATMSNTPHPLLHTPATMVRSMETVGYAVDGEWSSVAFVAEYPANPYLARWGWWDRQD